MLNFKRHVTLTFVLATTFSIKSYATELLQPEDYSRFNQTAYNALPLSAPADNSLKANGKLDQLLKKAVTVAEKYRVDDVLGFRLAHRHDVVPEDKIMVETFGSFENSPAYITAMESSTTEAYPASWIYTDSGYRVFEYSTDPVVQKTFASLSNQPSFWVEMLEVTQAYGLEKILAPSVLAKETLKNFDPSQPLYEIIDPDPYASILINKSREEIAKLPGKVVQTTWLLKVSLPNVLCVTYCHTSDDDWHFHEFTH